MNLNQDYNRTMTTTPQAALLSDDEIDAIWKDHVLPGFTNHQKFYSPIVYARSIEQAILAKLQATQADHVPDAGEMVTQEPGQAVELPDGWPDADGSAVVDCGPFTNDIGIEVGRYENHVDAWSRPLVEQIVRAALSARKPLTRRQINEASRDAQISFCLKSGGTYEEELARAIERAHSIGLEVKT